MTTDLLSDGQRTRNQTEPGEVVQLAKARQRMRRFYIVATGADWNTVARVETAASMAAALRKFCGWWDRLHSAPPLCVRIEPYHPGKHNARPPETSA